jgi:hypothetical protein
MIWRNTCRRPRLQHENHGILCLPIRLEPKEPYTLHPSIDHSRAPVSAAILSIATANRFASMLDGLSVPGTR